MKRKLIGIFAAVLALAPLMGQALGMQVMIDGKAVILKDIPQSAWYAEYVRGAAEAGIVSGYRDEHGEPTGLYGPDNRITQAEALKIVVEGAGYDEDVYASRIDSGIDHWSAPYVSVAKGENFPVIENGGNLNQAATRAEVAAMFAAAFGLDATASSIDSRFNDVTLSTKYAAEIQALSRDEIISGDTDINGVATGTFRPMDAINRAEVAKIVMLARAKYGQHGEGRTPTEEEEVPAEENTVTYTTDGFSPTVLRVKKGEMVTFKNMSVGSMWVASHPHPTHTDLAGFDAGEGQENGGLYSFTFNQIGSWGYHNHSMPDHEGTIIVEE
ncbi:MAG TPA: S-layer homology domain-containing protein [Candidatus Peribacteraceae bacterium]|nr:S-layer homology domain-containing protein [Candidatus Peribacteraceae bacterium]